MLHSTAKPGFGASLVKGSKAIGRNTMRKMMKKEAKELAGFPYRIRRQLEHDINHFLVIYRSSVYMRQYDP